MLFKKKLKKESIHITFGSSADDNEYYMEFRTTTLSEKPFLCLFTKSESIHVYTYEVEVDISLDNFVKQIEMINESVFLKTEHGLKYMDMDDFRDIISVSAQRLLKAKAAYLDVLKQHPDWDCEI